MNRRLLIATPAKSNLPAYYLTLFEQVLRQGIPGWDVDYCVECSNHLLNISRNVLAHQAIRQGFDRVLFLDTDHKLTLEHIRRLLSHEKDIVSALYSMKRGGVPFFLGVRKRGAREQQDGLLEAQFLPTGCLLCSIESLKKIQTSRPEGEFYAQSDVILPYPRKTPEVMFDFFPYGVNGPRTAAAKLRKIKAALNDPKIRYPDHEVRKIIAEQGEPGYLTGEDYHFSLLAYWAGVQMWLDVKCLIPHTGSIDYPITNESVVARECQPIPEHDGDIEKW